jgi:hypothetical protein
MTTNGLALSSELVSHLDPAVTSPSGPFLPVGDRQLSKVQRPVSRFAPELAASECRAVVISAQRSAALDPRRLSPDFSFRIAPTTLTCTKPTSAEWWASLSGVSLARNSYSMRGHLVEIVSCFQMGQEEVSAVQKVWFRGPIKNYTDGVARTLLTFWTISNRCLWSVPQQPPQISI